MANGKDNGKKLERKKDAWDKWDVVLRPVGGLLAAVSIALVGFFGSQYLEGQQATETNIRLYAELMSNREKADSDLRKEMFNAIIKAFLESKSSENKPENRKEVLALELIAYNFHDVIDLGPLFKHVEENIQNNPEDERKILQKRLEKVAREVADKQIGALEDVGVVRPMTVFFEDLENKPEGIQLLEETLRLPSADIGSSGPNRLFIVEVLDYDQPHKDTSFYNPSKLSGKRMPPNSNQLFPHFLPSFSIFSNNNYPCRLQIDLILLHLFPSSIS